MALIKKYNSGGRADKKSFFDHLNQKILTNADNLSIRDQEEILKSVNSPDFSPENSDNPYIQNEYKKFNEKSYRTMNVDPTGGEKLDRTLGSLFDYVVKKDFKGNKEYALRTISDLGKNKDGTYDNKKIQKYLIEKAREMTFEYNRDSALDTSGDNWKDKEHADNLISVLNEINAEDISEDSWNRFSDFSNPLGWQVNNLLMKPDEIARLSQISEYNQAQEKAKDEQKSNFNYFDSIGIKDEDMQKGLYEQGFRQIKEDDKNTPEFMRTYFKDKGYSLISDGKNRLVWNGEDFVKEDSGLFTDDQFSSNYGTGYTIGENGVLSTFDRDSMPSGFKLPEWEDVGNIRQQLLTETGKFGDYDLNEWRAIGDSNDNHQGDYVRDILQRRDLTGRITLENEKTKEKKVFVRQENGDYLDSASGEIIKKDGYSFLGPGEFMESIAPDFVRGRWENPKITRLSNRNARSPETVWGKFWNSDKDIHDVIKDFNTASNKLFETNEVNKKEIIKLIEHLKHYGVNGTDEEKQLANEQLENILKVLSHTDDFGKETFAEFKLGGIIRSQQGGSLWERTAAYVPDVESDYDPHKDYTQQQKSTKAKKVIDTEGTLSDSDIWEKISTGAAIASFLPGVGVAGGVVSTVADAIHGAKDGWDWKDTANLAANIGFTGLSLIGLGGLRGVKLAGKASKAGKLFSRAGRAAKVADKAGDLKGLAKASKMAAQKGGPEAVKAVSRISKLSPNSKLPGTITKLLSNADNIDNFDEIAKLATKAGYTVKKGDTAATLAKAIGTDLEIVNKLSKLSPTVAGTAVRATGRGINTAVTKGMEVLPGKVGTALKYGAIGNQVIQGGTSAKNIYDNVQEHGIADGLKYAKLSDIRKVGQLGALGFSTYQNSMNRKAYLQNSTEVGATPEQHSIKIGDKVYKTTEKVDTKKGIWAKAKDRVSSVTKEGKVAVRSNDQKRLKAEIEKVLDPSEKDKIDEIIKGLAKSKGKIENLYTAGISGTRIVNEDPLDYTFRGLRRHGRARRVEAYQTGNYSTSFMNRWFNRNPQLAPRTAQTAVTATPTTAPVTTAPTAPAAKINKVIKRAPRKPRTGPARGPQRATTQSPTKGNLRVAPKAPSAEKVVKNAFNNYLKTSSTYGSNNTKFSNFARTKEGKKLVAKYGYENLKKMSGVGKKREGGILLARTGLPLPRLTIPDFQWDKGIKTHLGNQYKIGGNRPPIIDTSDEALAALAVPGRVPYNPYQLPDVSLNTTFPRLRGTPTQGASNNTNTTSHINIGIPNLEAWEKKDRFDPYMLIEGVKAANVKRTNDAVSAQMERSFSEVPQYSGLGKTHMRTSSPYSLMYDTEARNQEALSGRLGRMTSDINLGIATNLQGSKNAAELRIKGLIQDAERNSAWKKQQMDSDSRIDAHNTSMQNQQRGLAADMRKKLYEWRAMKENKDGSNRNAFLSAGLAWYEGKEQKDAAHNYRDFVINNPNFARVQEGYNNILNSEAEFRKAHKTSLDNNWTTETKFEDSREGKEYAKQLKRYREMYMDPLRAESERLRFAAFGQ